MAESIRIEINRNKLVSSLVILLVSGLAVKLLADTMTMTTYYPAPTGIYKKMTTTGQTVLARDGDNVGIGMTNPQAKLDVNGNGIVRGNAYLAGYASIGTLDVNGDGIVRGSAYIGGYVRGATTGFGGIFTFNYDGSCRYGNPYTGWCSCPDGFWASPILEYSGPPAYCDYGRWPCGILMYQCVR